jgi:hypothetical protein
LSEAVRKRHWPFLWDCSNIRGLNHEGRVNRLYQWLSGRASFFRTDVSGRGTSRTIRTEVTVERQGMTLLVGGAAAAGFDSCPFCGNKLAPNQADQPDRLLFKGSISPGPGPIADPSPSMTGDCSTNYAALADNDATETEPNLALDHQGEPK